MKQVQVIRCKCGSTFAASILPYCFTSVEWQRDMRKYVKQGCSVEIMDVEVFQLEWCKCPKKKQNKIINECK